MYYYIDITQRDGSYQKPVCKIDISTTYCNIRTIPAFSDYLV